MALSSLAVSLCVWLRASDHVLMSSVLSFALLVPTLHSSGFVFSLVRSRLLVRVVIVVILRHSMCSLCRPERVALLARVGERWKVAAAQSKEDELMQIIHELKAYASLLCCVLLFC